MIQIQNANKSFKGHPAVQIQRLIDRQIDLLIAEMWNDAKVDKKKYEAYYQKLGKLN
jgi:hypothetical protein